MTAQTDDEIRESMEAELCEVALDLERCPRCGLKIEEIRWGQTDCPNCGLHFECC